VGKEGGRRARRNQVFSRGRTARRKEKEKDRSRKQTGKDWCIWMKACLESKLYLCVLFFLQRQDLTTTLTQAKTIFF